MQGQIENAMTLAAVGNACLRGADISGFWPDAPTFRWMKYCEFREPTRSGKGEFPLRAADPNAWFVALKQAGCTGLRLHHMERPRQPNQTVDAPDRMLVGFVGGGPRWLVETISPNKSEFWEGAHRLLDRNDPQQKIWGCTYIRIREGQPGDLTPVALADALAELRAILPEIEAFATAEGHDNFAECFASARADLDGAQPALNPFTSAFAIYAGASAAQLRTLQAILDAWVFGGMGSWNDIGGGARYDELSGRLFKALNDAICGLANSTLA